jgi:hypothetical protein
MVTVLLLYYKISEKNNKSTCTSWKGETEFDPHKPKGNSVIKLRNSQISVTKIDRVVPGMKVCTCQTSLFSLGSPMHLSPTQCAGW